MHRAEVIMVERRRRWSWTDKQQIAEEALMPGASISAVARRYGLHPSQVFAWRKAAREGQIAELPSCGSFACTFAPVVLTSEAHLLPSGTITHGRMDIVLVRTPVSMRRRSTASSMCWNGNDHLGRGDASVAGGRPHRHVQGLRWAFGIGTGEAGARPVLRSPVCISRATRRPAEGAVV